MFYSDENGGDDDGGGEDKDEDGDLSPSIVLTFNAL